MAEYRSSATRVFALWCPDWPAVAAAAEAGLPDGRPVAVFSANRVLAASADARAAGVQRGMRKRQAQSACPELAVIAADEHRDARRFEPVVAAVTRVVPFTEVLRPGLLVLSAGRATRYFAGEDALAEKLIDVVAGCGVSSSAGAADELFTAVLAAREGHFVDPGGDAAYLARRPIGDLTAEAALSIPERTQLVDLLRRLGIRTLGAFAALAPADVASRFSADAVVAHRYAAGRPGRAPSGRPMPSELSIEHRCEPPIDRVDAAAFLGRQVAAELHRRLAAAALSCTRLSITATTELGRSHTRVWRCAEPLTPEGTADRIRWQLEGWLTGRSARGATDDGPDAPIDRLRLEPVEVVDAGALQYRLSGAGLPGGQDAGLGEDATRCLVRVQGMLGGDAVRLPVRGGGRGPADQITLVPLGDESVAQFDAAAPWPDRLVQPSPAVLTAEPATVIDAAGEPVSVTGRGGFSREPAEVRIGRQACPVAWWAGPWPFGLDPDPGGSAAPGVRARAQVLLTDSRALLLCFESDRWTVEGVYE